MIRRSRRWLLLPILILVSWVSLGSLLHRKRSDIDILTHPGLFRARFEWRNVPLRHPPQALVTLPGGPPGRIPKVQHDFTRETEEQHSERQARLDAVKEAFTHSWQGYKKAAWLQDEVAPLTGGSKNGFGGWGATLVDSLDTLWIMGMKHEFDHAVHDLNKIDFKTCSEEVVNIFETTIRYLGGLLAAYDISGHQHKVLLQKAVELGNMIYVAFDTPNRMPITRWNWKNGALGGDQSAITNSHSAEIGSLSLEFTHLSQLTGDPKYYDAIARVTDVMEEKQNKTDVPGLWPVLFNALDNKVTDHTFSMGGMVDSLYEYLPKQHIMLGGRSAQYRNMYSTALESAKRNIFFRVLNPDDRKLTMAGTMRTFPKSNTRLIPQGQHLTCFAGGMVALGAKVFDHSDDLETARQLVDGCIWAYQSMPSGIMPESFTAIPCSTEAGNCTWSDEKWYKAVGANGDTFLELEAAAEEVIRERKLAPGFANINDPRFLLRPEAIESVFIMYRITGDRSLMNHAWDMFQAINKATRTGIAYASVSDVTVNSPTQLDSMESFWLGETLKYFYLIFSEPDVISLDDYVFNTEAHPLMRPDRLRSASRGASYNP